MTGAVATPMVPLDVLGKEIVACVQRAFRDQKKADEWRATAREKLNDAFGRTGGGSSFAKFLNESWKIEVIQDDSGVATPLSISHAYEIMGKTDEEMRADWRERARRKQVARNSGSPGQTAKPLTARKKLRSQPQLLSDFRKCVDAMTAETRKGALAYLERKCR